MALETNTSPTHAPKPAAEAPRTFAPRSAPTGKLGFFDLGRRVTPSRIDSKVEPYLKDIENNLNDQMRQGGGSVEVEMFDRLDGAYALRFDAPNGVRYFYMIQFDAGVSFNSNEKKYPSSRRLRLISEEISVLYKDSGVSNGNGHNA